MELLEHKENRRRRL